MQDPVPAEIERSLFPLLTVKMESFIDRAARAEELGREAVLAAQDQATPQPHNTGTANPLLYLMVS